MENAILIALSAQDVLQRRIAATANNLGNMDTSGFRAERLLVAQHPVPLAHSLPRGQDVRFVRDLATVRDPSPGRLDQTGNPLDLAVLADGYLVVSTADGDRFSRGAHLRLDAGGRLVHESGDPVQGQGGAAIIVTPEDGEPLIGRDGSISGAQGPIGKLRVVRFAADAQPVPAGNGLARSSGMPEEVIEPDVLQGMLERSNVQPISEMESLIRVHRAYEQVSTTIEREDERIRKMITVYLG
jgi:flagellar basal-body rod protein FlgF